MFSCLLYYVSTTKFMCYRTPNKMNRNSIEEVADRFVYKFQVVWNPVRQTTELNNDLGDNILMSIYRGKYFEANDIYRVDFPDGSPLRAAVENCRVKGIRIVTGVWKCWKNPVAILFDVRQMPHSLFEENVAKLKEEGIEVPLNDDKARQAIDLSHCAAEFLSQFETAAKLVSKMSCVRFHNWRTAAGLIFSINADVTMNKTFFVTTTRLRDMAPCNPDEGIRMSSESNAGYRYALELVAAQKASQLIIGKNANSSAVERALFRTPTHRLREPRADMSEFLIKLLTCQLNTYWMYKVIAVDYYREDEHVQNDLIPINVHYINTVSSV